MNPTDGCGTKQGREAQACQETAERLRKPESGPAVEVDGPPQHGAGLGDVVEGAENLMEAGPGARAPGSRKDVTTLEGIDSTGD